jgi:acyl carrier protein
MGLDIVEMCLDIEAAFGIEVPDQEWQEAQTVGQVYETVCRHLGKPVAIEHEGTEEWRRLLDVIQQSTSVQRSELHYYANFVRDLKLD